MSALDEAREVLQKATNVIALVGPQGELKCTFTEKQFEQSTNPAKLVCEVVKEAVGKWGSDSSFLLPQWHSLPPLP